MIVRRFIGFLWLLFFLPALSCFAVDFSLGRKADLEDPSRWEPWLSTVSAPSASASVEIAGQGIEFSVPESNKQMIWRQSLRPVWLDFHHYLTFRYRISGNLSSSIYSLLRLRTASESWFTVARSNGLVVDGQFHTLTIDLAGLTSAPQIVGVEVDLRSADGGGVSIGIDRMEFSDQPPGFEYPPVSEPEPTTTGFELKVSSSTGWDAKPEWLSPSNVSTGYSIHSTGSALICSVTDGSKGMKWRNASVGSQDTATYPYVLMHYRCENIRPSGTDYALWLGGSDGSDARPFYQANLIDDGLWHWGFSPIPLSAVTQMALQVQSDGLGGAFLEIESIAFVDGDPRNDLSYFTQLKEGWENLPGGIEGFATLDPGNSFNARADQLLPRIGANVSWFTHEEVAAEPYIPFRVEVDALNLIATELPSCDTLEIDLDAFASEVYLLLGAFMAGRENPSSESIITRIDEIERFHARIEYEDGSREMFYPVDLFSGRHEILNNSFSAYAIPCSPSKKIKTIYLHDGTDGGLFALAAVTLKTTPGSHYGSSFELPLLESISSIAQPLSRSPRVEYASGRLILENTWSRYEFDLTSGLALDKWIGYYSGHDLMAAAGDHRFFSGTLDATPFTSLDFTIGEVSIQSASTYPGVVVEMALNGSGGIIEATLSAQLRPSGEVEFAIALDNLDGASHAMELLFPDLAGITLSAQPGDLHYCYPSRTSLWGDRPIDVEDYYSGEFPMQFIDVYDPGEGWGLYLLVEDLDLIHKYYRLKKSSESASLSVRYPTLASTGLPAGERMEVAPFALGSHAGDWHEAMTAYQNWVSTWYAPQSPRQKWFQEIYTCRRDYPVSGSGYLFDRAGNQYTFDAEIANASRYLGGADLIDISSWGWSATYGRVGDYRRYELGGLDDFRSGIARSQSEGIPVGLYIEGYLLDDRSTAFSEHGEEWKMLNSQGSGILDSAHEAVICPYVTDWQDYMRNLYVGVVSETGADAMYIDVFGWGMTSRSCYSDSHGHLVGAPPLRGEFQLTRKVREGLNAVRPGIPLYTEFSPVDVTSQYQDGSFAYTIAYADGEASPTATSLFRFCFPDFKRIELVNGQFLARNWTEEGLKKAFFSGEGIWVKGEIASWYDESTIAFYIKSHEIFRDHRDAFRTDHPEPFLPTLAGGVFVHRFAEGDKQVLTFYNSNRRDVNAELASVGALADKHAVDLWGERDLGSIDSVLDYRVTAQLWPRDIGCVGIFDRAIEARREGNRMAITLAGDAPDADIELVGVDSGSRRVVQLPRSARTFDLSSYFDPMPDKVLVKLKQDGIVLDLCVVEGLGSMAGLDPCLWTIY